MHVISIRKAWGYGHMRFRRKRMLTEPFVCQDIGDGHSALRVSNQNRLQKLLTARRDAAPLLARDRKFSSTYLSNCER